MTPAIGNIAAPAAERLKPFCISKFAIHFGVDAPLANTAVGNARKIRFARHARSETHIQRVIPDVEFPHVRRVHGGDEVHGIGVGHVHDVFVRSDSVEPRDFVIRQFGSFYLQSKTGVCKPHDGFLRFTPAKNRQVPGWPIFDPLRSRIILLGQTKQN